MRSDPLPSGAERQPVSILKPVKGFEPELTENLTSFFKLDYPCFELIFSIADEADPARLVIEHLMRQHPDVPSTLIIGDVQVGPNPKVNNLIRGYDRARYDWVLISDSNVRVRPEYLLKKTDVFTEDVGVVTAVVSGIEPQTVGGALESVFLNTFYARWMFLASHFGRDCVVGKSMLFRKSTADRFGGFRQLGRFLAEDFMAGEAMRMLGLKIVTMHEPIQQPLASYRLSDFWRRHVRWGRIRKAQAPLAVFFEPWLGLIPSGILGAFALHELFSVSALLTLSGHTLFWLANDMVMLGTLGLLSAKTGTRGGSRVRRAVHMFLAWQVREILALPLWLHVFSGNKVSWRGTQLRVKSGGLLEVA